MKPWNIPGCYAADEHDHQRKQSICHRIIRTCASAAEKNKITSGTKDAHSVRQLQMIDRMREGPRDEEYM